MTYQVAIMPVTSPGYFSYIIIIIIVGWLYLAKGIIQFGYIATIQWENFKGQHTSESIKVLSEWYKLKCLNLTLHLFAYQPCL